MRTFETRLLLPWLLFLLVILPSPIAHSQDRKLGSFSFVNAIDSQTPTFLLINGTSYKIPGYKPGQMTISGQLYSGITRFEVSNERLGTASISAPVGPHTPIIIIAYVERLENAEGEIQERLAIRQLDSKPSKTFTYTGYYASNSETALQLVVNSEALQVPPLTPTPLTTKGGVQIAAKGRGDSTINATPERPAHFIVIAYDRVDGEIGLALFQDEPASE